jgi:hypothetical protein
VLHVLLGVALFAENSLQKRKIDALHKAQKTIELSFWQRTL